MQQFSGGKFKVFFVKLAFVLLEDAITPTIETLGCHKAFRI